MTLTILTSKEATKFSEIDILNKVSSICVAVDGISDHQELLNFSLTNVLELFKARRGSIFLLSADGHELILRAACGMKITEQKQMVKRLGEGVVGKVAEIKKPYH